MTKRVWLFDLDNTLHDAGAWVFARMNDTMRSYVVDTLGVSADEVGLAGAWSTVTEFAARPPKAAGTVVTDEGDGGVKLAEFLATNKFI